MNKTNRTAGCQFNQRFTEALFELENIRTLLMTERDEFVADPRNWARVGDMTYVARELANVSDHLAKIADSERVS